MASVTPTVAVERVHRGDLLQPLILNAEFRPFHDVDLHAKVAGFVREVLVDVGDRVQEGQHLATLEIPQLAEEIERADAMERRSEDESKRAELAYDQARLLNERIAATDQSQPRLIAQQELDDVRTRERTAKSTWDAARQSVRVAQAESKKLRSQLAYCQITAPFSGVITKRYADPGDLVRGGTSPSAGAMPLLHLSNNERLRLVFPVSAAHVPRIHVGDLVEVRLESPHLTFPTRITRFTRDIQTSTRTMEVETDIPNPDLSLVPGMYASVILQLDRRTNTLSVPLEAVSRQGKPSVLVVGPDRQIERRSVRLGLETPTRIEIVDGLQPNELVVVGGRGRVQSGQKVESKLIETGRDE